MPPLPMIPILRVLDISLGPSISFLAPFSPRRHDRDYSASMEVTSPSSPPGGMALVTAPSLRSKKHEQDRNEGQPAAAQKIGLYILARAQVHPDIRGATERALSKPPSHRLL